MIIYKGLYKKLIILKIKFHLKYIIHIILNEEMEIILYEPLDSIK
jgi:hypothetical protein